MAWNAAMEGSTASPVERGVARSPRSAVAPTNFGLAGSPNFQLLDRLVSLLDCVGCRFLCGVYHSPDWYYYMADARRLQADQARAQESERSLRTKSTKFFRA